MELQSALLRSVLLPDRAVDKFDSLHLHPQALRSFGHEERCRLDIGIAFLPSHCTVALHRGLEELKLPEIV